MNHPLSHDICKIKWSILKIITFLFPSAGENADVFKLCRKDKSSISRHNARRHNNSKDAPVIKSFYDKDDVVFQRRI